MSETEEIRLAFIDVAVFPDGSVRGGILTTDIQTRPYEFRVTSPIKPTQIQQILYGASLRDYVYGELICAPLVKATKEKLSVVLVQEPSIAAMRPLVSVPVILVRHNGKSKDDSPRAVNLSAHTNFQSELSFAKTVLTPIMQSHDLIEPFERLKLALNEVHRTGVGEKGKGG